MNTLYNEVNTDDGPHHSVNTWMTVTTNGETTDQRMCEVVEVTKDFIAGVQPREIDGVESFTYVGHDVEGGLCTGVPLKNLLMVENPQKESFKLNYSLPHSSWLLLYLLPDGGISHGQIRMILPKKTHNVRGLYGIDAL